MITFDKVIPAPNRLIYSGRGLNLVWFLDLLKRTSSRMLGVIAKILYETVKSLGADSKATDVVRVFKIIGVDILKDYFSRILKTSKKASNANKKSPLLINTYLNE